MFGLGELLVFERYPEETFTETVDFARRWARDQNMREERYTALAASASI